MSAAGTRPSPSPGRHAVEGAATVVAAFAVMAVTAWGALMSLGANGMAPVSRMVPTLVALAVGGDVSMTSGGQPTEPASGGGLGGFGGGLGMSLGSTGQLAAAPLTLSFLGAAIVAIGFFRPLRRRARPTSGMLWARCGGALVATAVTLSACAALARGHTELPGGVRERIGARAGGQRFGGGGGGLSSVSFRTDIPTTVFLGLLAVTAVLAVGCLAARRTTLPRPLALGKARPRWNPVASTLVGATTVLCYVVVALAIPAGIIAAATGREQAAKAAGVLLLGGPNLLAVLLTSPMGTSWQAAIRPLRPEGGGMMGMFGGGQQGGGARANRSVDLAHWSPAGVPLWLLALVLTVPVLVYLGYLAAARTPVRTQREEADALLDRHTDTTLRMGIALSAAAFLLPFFARGSLRISVSLMGSEMGGLTAGLTPGPGISPLIAFIVVAPCAYAGSRLHVWRVRRREPSSRRLDVTPSRRTAGPRRTPKDRVVS
ncbi:streptophobe family protein [Streptomyces youssoufiensis]